MSEDNSHAGHGAVVLDIGGTVGAVVVTMPSELVGQEVAIVPVSGDTVSHRHVGVVARPTPAGVVHSAVFGEVVEGRYALSLLPSGPVQLQLTVSGGEVTFATWPAD
jgi:hypothetical protein